MVGEEFNSPIWLIDNPCIPVLPTKTSQTPMSEQMEHCTIEIIHTGCNLYKAVDSPHRTHTNTARDKRSQKTHSPPNTHSETSLMIVMPQQAMDTRFRRKHG